MLRGNLRRAALPPVLALALALALSLSLTIAGVPGTDIGAAPPERLTLESFNKLMKVEKARAGTPRDANLERAMAMHGDPDTIRRWATQLESDKTASAAIKSAGMTAQEYTRTLVAVLQAYGVSGLKKQHKTVPDTLMVQIPPENLAFVDRHATEIESWGLKSGKDVKPNTMEDLYVEQDASAADAPKTAGADAAAAPAAKPASATTSAPAPAKKKDAKTAPKSPGSEKP
jgi:hypothetical protein